MQPVPNIHLPDLVIKAQTELEEQKQRRVIDYIKDRLEQVDRMNKKLEEFHLQIKALTTDKTTIEEEIKTITWETLPEWLDQNHNDIAGAMGFTAKANVRHLL